MCVCVYLSIYLYPYVNMRSVGWGEDKKYS